MRELLRDSDLGEVENTCECVGEGERERRPLMLWLVSEGAEGEEKPLRTVRGVFRFGCPREALLTCPLKLGYRGFVPFVRSRKECNVWVLLRLLLAGEIDVRAKGRLCSGPVV